MKCKKCKRDLPENSVFCNWCGYRQIAERSEIKVPPPKHNSKAYYNQVMVGEQRVYVSAPTEEEYYAKARAAKLNLIEIKKRRPKLTLGTAIDNYIKDNDAILSPATINGYESMRRTRFARYMDMDVAEIPYQRMLNEEAKKVSPKTVHNAWRVVTPAMQHAGEPVPEVNLPTKTKTDRPWLDYEQIQTFTAALRGKPYELGALLALNGLRRSEILHLTANDVDVDSGIIHVRGASVVGSRNKLVDKDTTKTQTSTRDTHIVIPRLSELIRGREGKLITTNPTTLYGSINGLCEAVGLPLVGVHGLRHSFASLAYHLKWSEATTMYEGGWSDPTVVHRIYTHLANQDANKDVKKMQKFYEKQGKHSAKVR